GYESRMNGPARGAAQDPPSTTLSPVSRVFPLLASLCALAACAGCGATGAEVAAPTPRVPLLPDGLVRSPDAKTTMDTNPANLASAVVTYSFGQLPEYIDGGAFRLLPHDMAQASVPGKTLRRVYRLTVPRT